MDPCATPLEFETLVGYWLGECGPQDEDRIEEHYFGCAHCRAQLEQVAALAGAVRGAFDRGRFGTFVSSEFARRLEEKGLRVREYRVPLNGSVDCTLAAGDQVLLGRMQVPLAGVRRVDAVLQGPLEARLEDVPFDAASGEVLMAPGVALFRTLPAHRQVVRLLSVEDGGERLLGEYTFNHSP
jgi:hypothetical protein